MYVMYAVWCLYSNDSASLCFGVLSLVAFRRIFSYKRFDRLPIEYCTLDFNQLYDMWHVDFFSHLVINVCPDATHRHVWYRFNIADFYINKTGCSNFKTVHYLVFTRPFICSVLSVSSFVLNKALIGSN